MSSRNIVRENQVGDRILKALENAAKKNHWLDRIKIHVERQDEALSRDAYHIKVKFEEIPPVSSNRSFYQQQQVVIFDVYVNLAETPAITLQMNSTLLRAGANSTEYYDINEPELGPLITTCCENLSDWCPTGLRGEVRQ